MKPRPADDALACLLSLLDEAYDKKAWHGPNLRGCIRRVTPEQSTWRPAPARHNIAEIVVHCAYWKYAVRRRLTGEKRGSFPLKGSNWFALPAPFGEPQWQEVIMMLDEEHRALRAAAANVARARLDARFPNSVNTPRKLIQGAAFHDVYHAGQIQTLKAMQK